MCVGGMHFIQPWLAQHFGNGFEVFSHGKSEDSCAKLCCPFHCFSDSLLKNAKCGASLSQSILAGLALFICWEALGVSSSSGSWPKKLLALTFCGEGGMISSFANNSLVGIWFAM